MKKLLDSIQGMDKEVSELPFSVYSSVHEQVLLNVPIVKPLLVAVVSGVKQLGKKNEIACPSNHFIFLSDSPAINMRNIPKDKAYLALLIEFDHEDFDGIPYNAATQSEYFMGETTDVLDSCLQQFIESVSWAPKNIVSLRKKEILMLLYELGYKDIASIRGKPKVSQQLHDLFYEKPPNDFTVEYICDRLAMSESTLRRKLKVEGTSVQAIKDRARLGQGLHLLQTTNFSISLIAEKCGYLSPSRFTDRFKGYFGLTPSELRKTKND